MSDHPPTARPAAPPSDRRWSGLRVAAQIGGFILGLVLLAWCVRVAMHPENREQLARLRDAGPGQVAAILGLSFASLAANGAVFWVMVRPVRRIDLGGMLSTNALATFLNYLPFKVGVVTRLIIHNRRDGVPVVTIGAWFAAMAVVLFASLIPPCVATLWLKRVDPLWFAVSGTGAAALGVITVLVARTFDGTAGAERLRRLARYMPMGRRFASSRFFGQAHAGAAILSHAPTVAAGIVLRLVDIGLQAARFVVVAQVLQQDLAPGRALMATVAYFLTGIFSPGGMLGTREGVTAWLFGADGAQSLAAAALLVGAAEMVTNITGAALGLTYLRPDRLFRWKRELPAAG